MIAAMKMKAAMAMIAAAVFDALIEPFLKLYIIDMN